VRIEVEATGGALLILADQFYPGWRATVDGEPAPLLAANYVLRAVPVPAGRHTVTMTYRPATFLFGLYLSLAAASLLLAVATATALQTRAR
ncbi:MAG TPA: YfhO family protein, partial [Armatimonadota bacterium]|nr:YfhO family protein [Armatimonadota bacterium]